MVSPSSKFYTVSTVFFHKDGRENVAFTNCISHFYIFVPTKATTKLANVNMVNDQEIEIILCCFTNCSIIYPLGPVYYFQGYPSNTISSSALKFYIGLKKVTYKLLEHCDFVDLQGLSWRSIYTDVQCRNTNKYLWAIKIWEMF